MPRVTAVICHYWDQRRKNVLGIAQDLQNSTRPPDRIIVWNNSPTHLLVSQFEGVEQIHAPANYECRGKFVAGLLDPSDYYLFMDDDTSVGPQTLACYLHHAQRTDFQVSGYWGVHLGAMGDGRRTFMHGTIVVPQALQSPVQVDAFHGRGMFVSYEALVRMFDVERKVRLQTKWKSEGDDLLIGLANPGVSWMVPMQGNECFVDLPPGSEAMQNAPGYFDMRDEFLNDALEVL